MVTLRFARRAVLALAITGSALALAGCAAPRPTLYDDPTTGRRCIEMGLSGCITYERRPY